MNKKKTGMRTFLHIIKERGLSFDIDGVEAATSYPAVDLFNRRLDNRHRFTKYVQDLKSYWKMAEWFEEIQKMDSGVVENPRQHSINIWNDPEVQGECKLERGVWALNRFLNNHDIVPYRITSRPSSSRDITFAWYRRMFPEFPLDRLYIQDGLINNVGFKVDIIRKLGIGFHLDDSVEHAEEIVRLGVWIGLVLQPWSENYVPTAGSRIIKPCGYEGRPNIIRAFLSLRDVCMASM